MAFYLGGSVDDEGVEIDERRYCGLSLPFGHDAQAKERFLLLWILQAGAQSTYGIEGGRAAMATLTRSFSPSLRIGGKAGTISMATMRTFLFSQTRTQFDCVSSSALVGESPATEAEVNFTPRGWRM